MVDRPSTRSPYQPDKARPESRVSNPNPESAHGLMTEQTSDLGRTSNAKRGKVHRLLRWRQAMTYGSQDNGDESAGKTSEGRGQHLFPPSDRMLSKRPFLAFSKLLILPVAFSEDMVASDVPRENARAGTARQHRTMACLPCRKRKIKVSSHYRPCTRLLNLNSAPAQHCGKYLV